MKVSFLVTYYNQAAYVYDSLKSIDNIKKTFEYEVLVGDDGSTDNTMLEIEKWRSVFGEKLRIYRMSRDDGVSDPVIRASNLRKYLLEECSGDCFSIIDGDDMFCDTDFMTEAVELFEKDEKISIVMFDYKIEDYGIYSDCIKFSEGIIDTHSYLMNNYRHAGTCVLRKYSEMLKVLKKSLYYDDNDITILNMVYGNTYHISRAIYVYRQHGDSIWHSLSRSQQGILNIIGMDNEMEMAPMFYDQLLYRYRRDFLYGYFRRENPYKCIGEEFGKKYLSFCHSGYLTKTILSYNSASEIEKNALLFAADKIREMDSETFESVMNKEKMILVQ